MSPNLPGQARVVIIGGGIVGCSVAYHLAKSGWQDVVLLEQNKLGGGTTWHAAGLVGRLRTSNSMTWINKYSAELYASLEAETGIPTGWKQCGSLIVATSEARLEQLRRTMAMARLFDVEAEMIGPEEAGRHWPPLRTDDLLGAAWLPHDGKVIPEQVALALAQGARNRGATIIEGIEVLTVTHKQGQVAGVETTAGTIACEVVVLCGGMWARDLALGFGVNLPLYPVEHHYVVSAPIPGVQDDFPVGRDPDNVIYFRSEGESIVLGAFQKMSIPWMVERIPNDFSFQLLQPDWPKFAQPLQAGLWRIPALNQVEFIKFVNGPESFTPDNNFLLGETPGLRGCFVAAGFNSVGIASAGGAGRALAEWIIEGEPTMDLWSVDVRRFGPSQNNRAFLRERVAEVLGLHYQMAWPNREFETGRGLRRTPIHDLLAQQGACFGVKMGWERPNWFAPAGVKPEVEYAFGRQNWFDYSAAEHRAARENVALFDQTSFAKYLFQGADTATLLQRLCGNEVDVAPGRVVYTAMLNARGTFESDLTVVRLAGDKFYLITSSGQAVRDFDWITRHIPAGAQATLTDVTSAYGVLSLMGPNARKLLSQVTEVDLSNEAFPFGTARSISLGWATVQAIRITYVGELGWELHIPMEMMASVYETLVEAGRDWGLVHAGHYAINSLRLEKRYLAWGADLSPEETPLEAGLGFALAWDKSIPFLGREALLKQRGKALKKRLVLFVLQDPEPVLWGNEPILRNGNIVGYTTSGAYGHTLGGAVAVGYVKNETGVDPDFIRSGQFEIEIAGRCFAAKAYLRAPYDPERRRILQ